MLSLFSNIYKYFVLRYHKKFDSGMKPVHKADCPVVSIGNLSVGGSGKTPLTILIAEMLLSLGKSPAVIGKGYKRKSIGKVIVSDGRQILSTAEQAGDEMLMIAEKLQISVLVHDEKYLAAQAVCDEFRPDCIIVDDGYQHRQLHRDLNLLILNRSDIENPHLLPKGRLREPLEAAQRADIIIADKAIADISDKLGAFGKPIVYTSTEIQKPELLFRSFDEELSRQPLLSFCGIARPDRFVSALKKSGYDIRGSVTFPDHCVYNKKRITHIIETAKKIEISSLITTEKDAVKIKNFGSVFAENNINCYVLPIELIFSANESIIREKLLSLFH